MNSLRRKAQIVVIGDANVGQAQFDVSVKIGELLAELDVIVITGGRGGVMEAVSKGARTGNAVVVGILPSADFTEANDFCSVIIPTGMGHARNAITALAGDIIIVIGGGAGTLSEISLGWIHNKPLIAYQQFGGWGDKLAGLPVDQRRNDPIVGVKNMDQLKKELLILLKQLGFS